jgi:hypothetical protein
MYIPKSLFSPPHRSQACLNFSTGFFFPSRPTTSCCVCFPSPLLPFNTRCRRGPRCTCPVPCQSLIFSAAGCPQHFLRRTPPHHLPRVLVKPHSTCVEHVGSSPQRDGSMAGFARCSWPIWHVDDLTQCFQRESVLLRHAPHPQPAMFTLNMCNPCLAANGACPATSRSSSLPLWCRCPFSTYSHKI